MKQCGNSDCNQEIGKNNKYCSVACSNIGRSRKRICSDGISHCTKKTCKCNDKFCVECNQKITSKYGQKFCGKVCQALHQHASSETIQNWLIGLIDATKSAGKGKCTLAFWARIYLLNEANWACTKCKWNEVHPLTGKPPLEIDHIDGNRCNNSRENLIVLCPNCHSLTITYRRHNYKNVQELKKTIELFK